MDKNKVLIVDDDIVLGNIMTAALRSSGYEVHYQTSLTALKSIVLELQPDMIVLDVEVGTKNGIDMAPELKLIAPDIPILFISSHTAASEAAKALHAGAVAYLKKPFEIEELLAYIERHVSVRHSDISQIGSFTLLMEDGLLMEGEELVKKLTLSESKLLKLLIMHANQTVSREEIEQTLWKEGAANEQSLNNFIGKLRKCLSKDKSIQLLLIPKVGYSLVLETT